MAHFVDVQNVFDRRFDRKVTGEFSTISEGLPALFPGFDGFEYPTVCCINEEPILQAEWGTRQLSENDVVSVVPVIGATVIAVLTLVVSVVSIVVSLTQNVPDPKVPGVLPEPDSVFSLQGQRNQLRLGEPIEACFGTVRRWPAYAAAPYNKYIDNEQYFYALFCVGQGEHEPIDAYLEDTQITEFADAEFDVIDPGENVNLFENNVVTSAEVGNIELFGPNEDEYDGWTGPFVLNPAGTTTDRVEVDFVLPQGLYETNEIGGLDLVNIIAYIEFQEIDDDGIAVGPWIRTDDFMTIVVRNRIALPGREGSTGGGWRQIFVSWGPSDGEGDPGDKIDTYTNYVNGIATTWIRKWYSRALVFSDRTTTPLRSTQEFSLPSASRWQVRAQRFSDADKSHKVGDTLVWEKARAFLPNTTDFGDVTLFAFKARASNSLNDNSQQRVNCWITRKLPIWDSVTGWSEPTATRSIVWAFCEVFRSKYGGGLSDNMLDLESLAELDAFYEGRGEYFDYIFANKTTVFDAAKVVARAGRAVPMITGTKIGMIRDGAASVPTALFGPHNMIKGSFDWEIKLYDENEPDAIEIAYTDPDTFKEETVLCGLDDDPEDPQRTERVVMSGVTDRDVAYREGLYMRATQRYIREQVKFRTGLEGRLPSYGDFVGVAHDLPQWGQSGRIKSIVGDVLTAQNKVEFIDGENHQIAFRDRYGVTVGPYSATPGGNDFEIILSEVLPPVVLDSLVQDDGTGQPSLFLFGITNDFYRQMKITRIENAGNNEVTITANNYSTIPHSFDGATAPPKGDTSSIIDLPDRPVIDGVIVDVLPNSLSEITVKWVPALGAKKYRIEQSYDGGETYVLAFETQSNFANLSVTPGEVYLRVAAVGQDTGPFVYWSGTVGLIPEEVDFDPPGGGIIASELPVDVTITSVTVGAIIRWSKTSIPINYQDGEEYIEPVTMSDGETLYARAFIASLLAGPGDSATYTLVPNYDFSNEDNSGYLATM